MVTELINSNGSWNITFIQNNFLPIDAETITNIPLPHHPCRDQVYWFCDKMGVYSIKSGHQVTLCLNHYQGPSTSLSEAWWKLIWSLSILPKITISFWILNPTLLDS